MSLSLYLEQYVTYPFTGEEIGLTAEPVHGTVPDMSELYTMMAINNNKLIQLVMRSLHNDLENTQFTSSKIVADRIETIGPT